MTIDTTIQGGFLGIKETALKLGVSEKTVRRHIKAGKLSAQLVPTLNGVSQWLVSEESIAQTLATVAVVSVKQEQVSYSVQPIVDRVTGVNTLLERLESRLIDDNASLRREVSELSSQVKTLVAELAAERKRSLWQRLRGKG